MFNKYNIYEKHMIIVTKEFEPQNSMISLEDMTYAGLTAQSLNGILYYNGGKISGAS
jgi:ATP adenylyltransferase